MVGWSAKGGEPVGGSLFLMGGSEAEIALLEAGVATVADHEVVEEFDAEEIAGGLEVGGGLDVFGGGGGIAAGVVVGDDDVGCVVEQGALEDVGGADDAAMRLPCVLRLPMRMVSRAMTVFLESRCMAISVSRSRFDMMGKRMLAAVAGESMVAWGTETSLSRTRRRETTEMA